MIIYLRDQILQEIYNDYKTTNTVVLIIKDGNSLYNYPLHNFSEEEIMIFISSNFNKDLEGYEYNVSIVGWHYIQEVNDEDSD